ncbi:Protein of unknown function, partial [Gryllus bimaculatus]
MELQRRLKPKRQRHQWDFEEVWTQARGCLWRQRPSCRATAWTTEDETDPASRSSPPAMEGPDWRADAPVGLGRSARPGMAGWGTRVVHAAYHGHGPLAPSAPAAAAAAAAAAACGYTATNGLRPDAAAASAPKCVISPSLQHTSGVGRAPSGLKAADGSRPHTANSARL